MPDKYYHRIAREDNCVYLFDYERNKWLRLSDVDPRDLPQSVRNSVMEDLDAEVPEDIITAFMKERYPAPSGNDKE